MASVEGAEAPVASRPSEGLLHRSISVRTTPASPVPILSRSYSEGHRAKSSRGGSISIRSSSGGAGDHLASTELNGGGTGAGGGLTAEPSDMVDIKLTPMKERDSQKDAVVGPEREDQVASSTGAGARSRRATSEGGATATTGTRSLSLSSSSNQASEEKFTSSSYMFYQPLRAKSHSVNLPPPRQAPTLLEKTSVPSSPASQQEDSTPTPKGFFSFVTSQIKSLASSVIDEEEPENEERAVEDKERETRRRERRERRAAAEEQRRQLESSGGAIEEIVEQEEDEEPRLPKADRRVLKKWSKLYARTGEGELGVARLFFEMEGEVDALRDEKEEMRKRAKKAEKEERALSKELEHRKKYDKLQIELGSSRSFVEPTDIGDSQSVIHQLGSITEQIDDEFVTPFAEQMKEKKGTVMEFALPSCVELVVKTVFKAFFEPFAPGLNEVEAKVFNDLFQSIRLAEPQGLSGRWRSMTFARLIETHKKSMSFNEINELLSVLSLGFTDLFSSVGVTADDTAFDDHRGSLTKVFQAALDWRTRTMRDYLSVDYAPVVGGDGLVVVQGFGLVSSKGLIKDGVVVLEEEVLLQVPGIKKKAKEVPAGKEKTVVEEKGTE
ncbi:hypothetical protein T439DRAFT_379180 [Meredithblackwellia eburnea MCA 4105]